MKKLLLGLALGVGGAVLLLAQTKINPTDPQPTCNMCPGTYIPLSELEAYTKKAIAENLVDQQVRDINIGKSHIGIGMVHRGKLEKPGNASVGCRAQTVHAQSEKFRCQRVFSLRRRAGPQAPF